ncbi:MAG TPA: flagellar export chaperone FliS [Nitrospirales bacterium]|nr:flagellar export chaperone FliS [Nitrospirales bacterium]
MKGHNGKAVATTYQHGQVTHADPVQLIVMLYDGALSRIAQARQRFLEGDKVYGGIAVARAQAIIAELRKSLNLEEGKDIAANLDRLYQYIYDVLVKSLLEHRTEPLDEAARVLNELRGAWAEVAKQCKEVLETMSTQQSPSAAPDPPPPAPARLAVRI